MIYLSLKHSQTLKNKTELLKPQELLVLDVLSYAQRLLQNYASVFQMPETGVYFKNAITPVLKPGRLYYTEESQEPITALKERKKAVFDENGTIVIPRFMMERQ